MLKPWRNGRELLVVHVLAGGVLFGLHGVAVGGAIRVWPGDGGVAVAKEFRVAPGMQISGIRLASPEAGTAYPEMRLVPGSVHEHRDAIRVAHNVVGQAGQAWAAWQTHTVGNDAVYHVLVYLPAEPQVARLPRLGTLGEPGTDGVHLLADGGELIAPVVVNLDCDLVIDDAFAKSTPANQAPASAARQEIELVVDVQQRAVALNLSLGRPERVRVAVYDVRGRLVRSILSGSELLGGEHTLAWDLRDRSGNIAAHGAYFIHVASDHASLSRRLVLR